MLYLPFLGIVEAMRAEKDTAIAKAELMAKSMVALMHHANPPPPGGGVPLRLTTQVIEMEDIQKGIVAHAEEQAKALPDVCGHISRTVIVMGSRGLGALARLCLGSCTNYALHKCDLPLIAVH